MGKKNDVRNFKISGSRSKFAEPEDMDDEIDVFHKQRDIVPLDLDDDFGDSSGSDDELPVLGDKDIKDDTSDEDEDYGDDDDVEDDVNEKGLVGKMARQLKYLREKFPGVDEMKDGEDEDEEEEKHTWTGKGTLHGGDNRDIELDSSDEEDIQEEENEVVRLQKEKAGSLSVADFGIEDLSGNERDQELSLEAKSVGKKISGKVISTEESADPKHWNTLSREEQMNVVYSSAPELVGLHSELNGALEQLETRINPALDKAKELGIPTNGGLRLLETNQQILMVYCQYITFYLLLKSEGLPVNDHPVIERLVDIKSLLDKMNHLGGDLPVKLDEFLKKNISPEALHNFIKKDAAEVLESDNLVKEHNPSIVSEPHHTNVVKEVKEGKRKRKNDDDIGVESTEMLRARAVLEEKLKQKGAFSIVSPDALNKVQKKPKLANGRLETRDDFDDDTGDLVNRNHVTPGGGVQTNLYSKKLKVISGDEDIPRRDDIGERRRKHEMRVLATAGIKSSAGGDDDELNNVKDDDDDDNASEEKGSDSADESSEDEDESEDVKSVATKSDKRNARAAAATASLPETVVGKRPITNPIKTNRGLTRQRNKSRKNPRKNNRLKHEKAEKRRKGQVVNIKKQSGPYGGEVSGINPTISRSVRMSN